MKKLLLASVGVVAMATAATAADLPARYPTKAPAYVVPLYNWTGFYLGAHVGWGWADFDGGKDNGFVGGGQLGFNYQINQFVIGVEGDVSWTDIGESVTGFVGAVPLTVSLTNDWIATLAARAGVAVGATGNVLLYVKGGVAWTDWSVSATALGVTASVGDTATGYILGAGIEYGFTPNWTAKLEYNYLDFNGSSLTLAGVTTNYDLSHSVVKVGVNYKFGGYR
jgi:outer membrane immunogenic protein